MKILDTQTPLSDDLSRNLPALAPIPPQSSPRKARPAFPARIGPLLVLGAASAGLLGAFAMSPEWRQTVRTTAADFVQQQASAESASAAQPAPTTMRTSTVHDSQALAAAVADAAPGDVIQIAAGTYDGPLVLRERVSLVAAAGAEVVIKADTGHSSVIQVAHASGVILDGLRLKHAAGPDDRLPRGRFSALSIEDAEVRVRNCSFTGAENNGVNVAGDSEVVIESCVAAGNRNSGIWWVDKARGAARRNQLRNNGQAGVVVWGDATEVVLSENQFSENGKCNVHRESDRNVNPGLLASGSGVSR